jgi:hypothetical protein
MIRFWLASPAFPLFALLCLGWLVIGLAEVIA